MRRDGIHTLDPPGKTVHRRLVALATSVLVAASLTSAPATAAAHPQHGGPPTGACDLRSNKGKIQHVIYIQFDNVHFERDNPNVPSDLEQMPNLLNFIKDNGTLDTNDHTVLISHTGGGILSSLTGLYPDRHGQGVSNAYGLLHRPDGFGRLLVVVQVLDGQHRRRQPGEQPADSVRRPELQHGQQRPVCARRHGRRPQRAGAVGAVHARRVRRRRRRAREHRAREQQSIITRSTGNTTLAARSTAGATSITVASAATLADGQTIVLENGTVRAEVATISPHRRPDGRSVGTARERPQQRWRSHRLHGRSDRRHDEGLRRRLARVDRGPELADRPVRDRGARARADRLRRDRDPLRRRRRHLHTRERGNARTDSLPDEKGGYTGFKGLFGDEVREPGDQPRLAVRSTTPSGQPIKDPFGQPGFPGFDGMFAKNTLGMTAQMQEAGVPVTFTYISDAHDFHGVSGNTHVAYGPGEAGYVQQLKDYDAAFADFFTRMQNDGITRDNTLFVVTVEEGDHFAGTAPDAPCDGVSTPCTYANGHVTEANGDLRRIIAKYNADHGTSATTDFSVHSDMAPNVYIKGNPARDSATARDLEKAMLDVNVMNPLSGVQQKLMVAAADPVEQKLLHMVTADPLRTPTFTPFAVGDYPSNASSLATPATPCDDSSPTVTNHCVFLPNTTPPAQTFAWNHGGIQPEVRSTWIGWVGPGVEKKHQTAKVWTDHTDIRPTMLALLGLKDSYVSDGRVVTEFLKSDAIPKSLKAHKKDVEKLGAMWKQVNASFGQFSLDTLCASTGALASDTAGDTIYTDTENALASLGTQRDGLADRIRLALWKAEFGNQKVDPKKAKAWIEQGQDYLDQAAALCHGFSSASANPKELAKVDHIVVIYEENHSFDNLYGGWEGVNGLSGADDAHTTQIDEAGNAYACLKQNDANLQAPSPLATTCTDSTPGTPGGPFGSHFANAPFTIDDYIAATDSTCPPNPLAGFASPGGNGWPKGYVDPTYGPATSGGCTRDIVHRFYHEQYQLDGGAQDRYVTGSDAMGLAMGVYDTKALPIYQYLHGPGHPNYAIEDNFFQAAFGGSFLNHQWLIAAASPVDPGGAPGGANASRHPVLDANGMPSNEPLYTSTIAPPIPPDRELTATCDQVATLPGAGEGTRLRQLRRQHHAASLLSVRHVRCAASGADRADDRRSSQRRRRRLGVVRGRLVER